MAKKQSFDAQTLLKHHYWIVATLGGLVLPVFWYLATDSLAELFDKGKKDRETVRTQVEGFQPAQQPNEEINKVLGIRHVGLSKEVYEAWTFQYQRQQRCMHWNLPAVSDMWDPWLIDGVDSEGKEVEGAWKKSDQLALENARTKGADLDVRIRRQYAGWLKDAEKLEGDPDDVEHIQFRRVYLLIGLRKPAVAPPEEKEKPKDSKDNKKKPAPLGGLNDPVGSKGQDAGNHVAGTQYTGLVVWSESERNYLENKFGKGPAWNMAPSTAQVVYTQESMNVYAMLLHYIVAKTNRGQTEHQLVPVKWIQTIRFGEDCELPSKDAGKGGVLAPTGVPGAVGAVNGPGAGAGVLGGGGGAQTSVAPFSLGPLGGAGGGNSSSSSGAPAGAGGFIAGAAAAQGPRTLGGGMDVGGGNPNQGGNQNQPGGPPDGTNRYVDYDGNAVPDPKHQPSAEYRMLPVVMRFVMDHRMFPELLACCVESPLPIEVRQWNMREPGEQTDNGGGGGGAGASFGPAATSGVGARKDAPKRGDTFGGEVELGPYDREIEIRGVIYLYNPPDPKRVGKAASDEPAAVPAAVPEAKQPAVGPEKSPVVGPSAKTPGEKAPEAKTTDAKTPEAKTSPAESSKTGTEKAGTEKAGTEKAPAEKAKTGAENGRAVTEKAPVPSKEAAPKPTPPADSGAKTPAGKS